MSNNINVSFLISVFNDEKYISKALESAINQDYKNFEIVVVNDGSTDNTNKILYHYKKNYENIILIDNKINKGLTKCLNQGLLVSRGNYIARLDSDDQSKSNRLSLQIQRVAEDSSIAVVASPVLTTFDELSYSQSKYLSAEEIKNKIQYVNCLHHSSVLMKKEVIIKVGGYNEFYSTSQDYDLWFRVLDQGYKIVMVKEPLVKRIILKNSISRKKLFIQSVNSFLIRKKYSKVLKLTNYLLFLHQIIFGFISNLVCRIR
jgi:glycosyltransferase EpsE